MTQDEIIRMAHKAGSHEYGPLTRNWSFELSQLERFAALVAEATKEKMKKVFAVATPKSTWTTDRIIAEIEDMK
jgi:hypothetical protein